MRLRGIDFGHVFNASGARNFDGSGWWHHHWLRRFGLSYEGSTFIAKTTTLAFRQGNMPIDIDTHQPKELFPGCVKINWWKGAVLNSVGLSGPGLQHLLARGAWYKQTKPFFISFMAVGKGRMERLDETARFARILKSYLPFKAPVGLQMNFSCPNVGIDSSELYAEIIEVLDAVGYLDIPIVAKVNAATPRHVLMEIQAHKHLDAVSVSNSIPWGKLSERIDWEGLFGEASPLEHLGGGGLSGKPLLPVVKDYIFTLRKKGFRKPIMGGGGVLSWRDAEELIQTGADAIELGSVSILRPWRVQGIINHVNTRLG